MRHPAKEHEFERIGSTSGTRSPWHFALFLSEEQWDELLNTRRGGVRFSWIFPHKVARRGKRNALSLIAISGANPQLRLGIVRSIQSVATFDSRVTSDLVNPISPGSLNDLLERISNAALKKAVRHVQSETDGFQLISRKLGEHLIGLIAAEPTNEALLRRVLSWIDRPKWFDNAQAMQADALNVALKAFGVVEDASSITLDGDTGIGALRIQEDAVIEHDARWIEGWNLSDSDLTGHAVFERRGHRLEVFTANKRPLEEIFGVDLIYLNASRGALVMVQYKMLEPGKGNEEEPDIEAGWENDALGTKDAVERKEREWLVRIDQQFKDEMGRMKTFDQDLSPTGPYRLHSGAFYFKLVRRHASTKSAGIMLSLGHVEKMIADGDVSGPRGGLRISYKELDGHYLTGELFVDLVRSGYIGTRGATTDHLQALIAATLAQGKAVVAAIQSASIANNLEGIT